MYTNQGVYSCDTETPAIRQGSLGHEREDALQLAGWNVAYMKVGPFWQNVVNDNTDSVFLS
jgi:alpha-galactosidase